jgi:hypothetical protein
MGNPVAQTSKSAVSQVSKPANGPPVRRPADLEIGDTAGWETCATPVLPAITGAAIKYPGWRFSAVHQKANQYEKAF